MPEKVSDGTLIGVPEAKIMRAVRDAHGGIYYAFAGSDGPVWLSLSQVEGFGSDVVVKLARHGIMALTAARKTAIKRATERFMNFEDGFVSAHPGYVSDDVYVCGDGEVLRAAGDGRDVIVVFEPDLRFRAAGDLAGWRAGLDRVIPNHATASFLLAYALSPLLLRFAPSSVQNPYVELVGPPESGKTSFAVLASSVFAGGDGQLAGGETWNATAGALDQLRERYSDSMHFIDEQNEQDAGIKADSSQTFKSVSGSRRRRYNEINLGPAIRLATLSTSNEPFSGLGKAGTATAEAAATRRLALLFEDRILQKAPKDFETTAQTLSAMREVINKNYGVAARAFVHHIIRETYDDGEVFRARIAASMDRFECSRDAEQLPSARIRKIFGLIGVAGQLAQEWNILPAAAMPVKKAISEIIPLVLTSPTSAVVQPRSSTDLLDNLIRQLRQHTARFNKIEGGYRCTRIPLLPEGQRGPFIPLGAEIVERSGRRTLYLRPEIVRDHFGKEHRRILGELRDSGHLRSEGGTQPKLLIKAPARTGLDSRVYAFFLG